MTIHDPYVIDDPVWIPGLLNNEVYLWPYFQVSHNSTYVTCKWHKKRTRSILNHLLMLPILYVVILFDSDRVIEHDGSIGKKKIENW